MRYSLILVLLCYTLTLSGTTYYIDSAGNNANNGSISSPWKTLAYACSKATSSGDIIHVNAGTFTETAQSILAVGVSIEGEGVTSIINSNLSTTDNIANHLILLQSSTLNTNGNQSISYLKLEGNNTAFAAILVLERGNVSIHHCTIQNFFTKGVAFVGADYFTDNEATTKAVGNSFHDNILTNCADYPGTGKDPTGWGRGNIEAGSQRGMLIYNNTIVQTNRGVNNNGFCIKYTGNGYMEGLKIYNNTITKPAYDGATWDFAIELWNNRGGTEIYGNTIQGAIDFGGGGGTNNDAHNYGFMAKVYNNYIGQPSLRSHEENGIYLERAITGGTYIYNNTFKNLSKAIISYTGAGDRFEDVYIYYNIISHVQSLPEDGGGGIVLGVTGGATDVAYNNVHAINNVIIADGSKPPAFGIYFYCKGNATNIVARNNIIQGFASNPIYINASGTINSCYIQNNLSYGNGLNSATFDKTPSGPFINSNPTPANPMFVSASDFHLSSNSPAIAAGLHITTPTISTDYDNKLIDNIPEIGAFEYGTSTTTPVVPDYVSSVIAGATPSLLEMTYNQTLASIVPAAASFTVLVNSVVRTINTVVISGTKIQLTLVSRIASGDIVTVSYIIPAGNPIQTIAGGIATGFNNQTVINNCINVAPTIAITSPVMNSSFTSLANITITASALDADGSVSMVEYYNGSVKLGSNSVAPYSYTWNNVTAGNYSLTVIATDNQNAKTTSSAVSISVTNSNHTSNRHPVIRIFNPRKGLTYNNLSTIEIDADASDPDGTISKVEFYNGQSKLVELTSAPYIYTWKDVVAGTYTITAIATDNLNDTTISSPIEFVVGAIAKYDANSDIINLYPNPNNGHFSIDFINPLKNEKSEIIITDLSGKQVYNGPVLKEELSKQFDLSDIKSGMYVMIIKDKEILVTKKFIKK